MVAVFSEFKSDLKSVRQVLKDQGLRQGMKTLWKAYGWKMVAAVLAYYIVRDVTLYVILPALFVKSLS
jgi:hypothetical protein